MLCEFHLGEIIHVGPDPQVTRFGETLYMEERGESREPVGLPSSHLQSRGCGAMGKENVPAAHRAYVCPAVQKGLGGAGRLITKASACQGDKVT